MIEEVIEWVGLDRVEAGFSRMERSLESLHPLWDKFDDEFYLQEQAHFALAPWEKLTDAYAKRKAKKFGARPILQATGVLFDSLTKQGARFGVRRPRNLSLEIGTSDPIAGIHQEGAPRINLPARAPLAEPDEDQYATVAGDYLDEIVRNAGFN